MTWGSGRAHLLLAWMGLVVLALVGCKGCNQTSAIAILEQRTGQVQRDYAAKLMQWRPAPLGADFDLGDAVRTLAESNAALRLDDGSRLMLQSDTVVRFSPAAPKADQLAFDIETGTAAIEAGRRRLSIVTQLGIATIEAGSTVMLERSEEGLRFLVQVGQAVFGEEALSQGQEVRLDPDGQRVEPPPPVAPEPEEPSGAVQATVEGSGASFHEAGEWKLLDAGKRALAPGSRLKLDRKTSVSLSRSGRRARLSGEGEYWIAPEPGVLVSTTRGGVTAGGERSVRVAVPGGVIVVAAQGKASLEVDAQQTRVLVLRRQVSVETGAGRKRFTAGQSLTLQATGEVEAQGVSVPYADLDVNAGETLTIHDPRPPTAVRFHFEGKCEVAGMVEVGAGKRRVHAAGQDQVALELSEGLHRYRLRCVDSEGKRSNSQQQGRIRVLKDAGTRGMAARAPVTEVLADGRKYTVLYQNRLPTIDLKWVGAPDTDQVLLVHEYRGKKTQHTLSKPFHRFQSGKLFEGSHLFHFEAQGKLSRRTTVQIRFDNAAPTASLTTPVHLSGKPGEPVTITGIALPGWDVLVEGERPRIDSQGRFQSSSVIPTDRRAISVRISHRQRGAHVYLRRSESP